MSYEFDFSVIWEYRHLVIAGFWMTVRISLVSLFLAGFLGLVGGGAGASQSKVARFTSSAYVEFTRNIPILIHVLFWYVGLSMLRIPSFWCAVLGLSIHTSAYVAEVVRAGINSIPKGQVEAGLALGLSRFQTNVIIIYPQAVRMILPSVPGLLSQLVKDSSLAAVIAVPELTYQAGAIEGRTFRSFEAYISIAVLYFLIVNVLSSATLGTMRWRRNRARHAADLVRPHG